MRIHPEYIEKEQPGHKTELQLYRAGGQVGSVGPTVKAGPIRGYSLELGKHGISWETTTPGYMDEESQEQRRDYRILMAHTVSDEDYKKMAEEGFQSGEFTPEETVTIVDRIKLDLVRGGASIEGYTDRMSSEALEEMLGDEGLALEVAEALQQADLPCTEDNIGEVCQATAMAMKLREPEDSEKALLIRSGEEPRIETLYRIENSGTLHGERQAPTYFAEEVGGYFSKSAVGAGQAEMGISRSERDRVVENVLEEMGAEATDAEELRQAADWLIRQGLEVGKSHLERYKKIQAISFPVTRQDGIRAAVYALMEGKRAAEGDLSQTRSLYRRAIDMEQTRLHMTAEVNLHLLRQGIALDTYSVEDRIRILEQGERQVAEIYFGKEIGGEAVSRYRWMTTTLETLDAVKDLPEDVLTVGRETIGRDGLPEFRARGEAIKADYMRAGAEYEKLMTRPVKNMGDVVEKAFGDIDILLEQMGWEVSEDNRRSMRILVRSHMELTEDKLQAVHAARELTESVMQKMTPGVVWKMIREGVNPLEKTLDELDLYLSDQEEAYLASGEGYAAFLNALERRGDISDQERSAYIGIYRVMYQLEKGEGVAIGAMVEERAGMGFQSLLRAMRTEKSGGLDMRLGEGLPLIGKGETDKGSMVDQIEGAFRSNHPAYGEDEVLGLLDRGGQRPTAYSMQAAWSLLVNPFGVGQKDKQGRRQPAGDWDAKAGSLLERLGEAEFEKEYRETLEEGSETVTARMKEETQVWELGRLRATYRQIELAKRLTREQEYFIPMEEEDGTLGIHLRLQRAPGERSRVHISLGRDEKDSLREISGEIEIREGAVWAGFRGNRGESIRKLQEIADTFKDRIANRWTIGAVVVQKESRGREADYWISGSGEADKASARDLYAAAKIFLQSVQAVERRDEEGIRE